MRKATFGGKDFHHHQFTILGGACIKEKDDENHIIAQHFHKESLQSYYSFCGITLMMLDKQKGRKEEKEVNFVVIYWEWKQVVAWLASFNACCSHDDDARTVRDFAWVWQTLWCLSSWKLFSCLIIPTTITIIMIFWFDRVSSLFRPFPFTSSSCSCITFWDRGYGRDQSLAEKQNRSRIEAE